MAVLDNNLVMSDSTAMPTSTTTAVVGTPINFGSQGTKDAFDNSILQELGEGGRLAFNLICEDEDFASGGTPAITYKLITADNSGLSTNATTLIELDDSTLYSDGDQIARMHLPAGRTIRQYVGFHLTVCTASLSA